MDEGIKLISLFFIYSVVGWLWETVYCSFKAGHFVYRGFLIGPYCPIYGFGILGVLYFLDPLKNNLLLLYISATVLVTVLEYFTSYALEKLFHASWWDYTEVPLNLHGRIAVPVSLFWGVGCLIIVKSIHPRILLLESFLARTFGWYLPALLVLLLVADSIYTIVNMQSFRKLVEQMNTELEAKTAELSEVLQEKKEEFSTSLNEMKQKINLDTQERNKERTRLSVNRRLEEARENPAVKKLLAKFTLGQRRLIKNYPKLKLKDTKNGEEIRELIRKYRQKNS